MTGIEPASSAWKAGVLPLNYTHNACVLDKTYWVMQHPYLLAFSATALRTGGRTRTYDDLLVRQGPWPLDDARLNLH